jgi:dienelactone hydrolase
MKVFFAILVILTCVLSSCSKEESAKTETTNSDQTLSSKEITYSADTTNMKGYMVYPKNLDSKKPGILVVHEWWGQTDYARMRADMLAELGYIAFAVDMYGNGQTADEPKGAQKLAMSVMGNFETAKARFAKALETLKADPNVDPDKIGAIGYCFGGSVVLSMANAGIDLDAVVGFHAGLQLPAMPEKNKVKAKILVCNGAADPMIPADQVSAFKKAMDKANVNYKYISYEGALHAFTNPAATEAGKKFNLPIAYDEKADKASWEEMKQFFATTL